MLASDSGARGKRSAHRHIGTNQLIVHGGDRIQQEVALPEIQKEAALSRIQMDTGKHDGCDEERNALLCEGLIITILRSDARRQMTTTVLRDSGPADSKNELCGYIDADAADREWLMPQPR